MIRPAFTAAAFTAFALGLTVPAAAQVQSQSTAQPAPQAAPLDDAAQARLRAQGEAYHRAPDSAQNPDELTRTQILNAEIAAGNMAAADEEREAAAFHAQAVASHQEEEERAAGARAEYEATLRASEAAQARYNEMYAAWEAQVRACNAGDRRGCAAGPARFDPTPPAPAPRRW